VTKDGGDGVAMREEEEELYLQKINQPAEKSSFFIK
jgi:hypothetical protein